MKVLLIGVVGIVLARIFLYSSCPRQTGESHSVSASR